MLIQRATIPHGNWLSLEEVRQRLQNQVNAAGGQTAWAKRHGVSLAYVNDVLKSRRLPGNKITKSMGLEGALLWRTPSR